MPRRKPEAKPREGARTRREMIIKKDCRVCKDDLIIDYKQSELLKKILPRRITGNCAYHQRMLGRAIKRARVMLMVR